MQRDSADGPPGGANAGSSTLVVRGVGALAADAVAQAAELTAALARQAGQREVSARAQAILARAAALSVSNELAFTRASRELDASSSGQGDELELGRALERAADVPLQVCEAASDLVALTAGLAAGAMSDRKADLAGIALLAAGACTATAHLVGANAGIGGHDPRHVHADALASAADASARRMLDEGEAREPTI